MFGVQNKARPGTIFRVLWVVLLVLCLGILFAGIPARFAELIEICTGEECLPLILSGNEILALDRLGMTIQTYAVFQSVLENLVSLLFIGPAILIFWRRSGDKMSMVSSLALILVGTIFISEGDSALVRINPNLMLLQTWLTSLTGVMFVLLLFLFPNGHFVPRWTRFWWGGFALIALADPLFAAISPVIRSQNSSVIALVLFLLSLLIGGWAQVYRYRGRCSQAERQQTKWVVLGLIALICAVLIWSFGMELFPFPPGSPRLYFNVYGMVVITTLLLLLPFTLTVSILRYHLFDIDIIIRRTLQYTILTGMLALVYFSVVVLLQEVFVRVTGQRSQIAIAISTLAIAALFSPFRTRIQDFINRRFYRKKYNAEQTLTRFAATARDEVDIDRLTDALLGVVEETMQPEQVSLWFNPIMRSPSQLTRSEGSERVAS